MLAENILFILGFVILCNENMWGRHMMLFRAGIPKLLKIW